MLTRTQRSISISGVSGDRSKGASNKANGEREAEEMQGLLATGKHST